jgi:hypothetical protein
MNVASVTVNATAHRLALGFHVVFAGAAALAPLGIGEL